ncbi:carboxymuconolactone decarboxylase family protein [Homoserinibacter sp. YIM 151385]|uniref:carboxymuconolactone decarboxylase family protein n=1 Tax=Homoserinibacter sp. YIM 151385 TaxID=2985506 RepID=UPI0022F0E0C8|nr:carboxymuconolactone decarboxylase family protein [Homoserinibacter sp. YIM 151385]WBU37083.1 carboxymuconolactone decarboxylase family protein [Homoserinibacter sp. YIM 151385]
MSRVPAIDPAGLEGAGAELYAVYTTGERAAPGADFRLVDDLGRLTGPPASWMLHPELGLALEGLGGRVRFGLDLSPRQRELVILAVAEAEDSDFERFAHHRAARRAGIDDAEIARLATGGYEPRDAGEAVLLELTADLLAGSDVADELWGRAEEQLGRREVFEVVTLIGYYRMMALQLRAYRIRPPM